MLAVVMLAEMLVVMLAEMLAAIVAEMLAAGWPLPPQRPTTGGIWAQSAKTIRT